MLSEEPDRFCSLKISIKTLIVKNIEITDNFDGIVKVRHNFVLTLNKSDMFSAKQVSATEKTGTVIASPKL